MTKVFLRGLAALLPISLTLYFIYWLTSSLEILLSNLLANYVSIPSPFPGIGLLIAILSTFILGLLLGIMPFSKLFSVIQLPFKNIPLVKSIYSAIEDLTLFFGQKSNSEMGKVVKVQLPGHEIELIGLLTQSNLSQIKNIQFSSDKVAVFIPMSYQLGGYTIFVPSKNITITDMKVEVAMKSAITAWMKKHPNS